MLELNELSARLQGLPTIFSPFTLLGFGFVAVLCLLAFVVSWSGAAHRERIDRSLFWIFGLALVAFAVLRPIGLGRDDLAYVEILKSLCSDGDCSKGSPATRDWVWYGLVRLGLPLWPGNLQVALAISGVGVLIKLFVIDRLCKERLLALLLLIPLSFVQYDLTQLRAGLASSWMMLGIYWLVRSQLWLGGIALVTNFTLHSQAIFSPALLGYRVFGLSRWILPTASLLALALLYGGFYPSASSLAWLGLIPEAVPYYSGSVNGAYLGVKLFPWAYFLILGYGIWLCDALRLTQRSVSEIASAGLFLGMFVAWFFAINPTMQTRIFEFYAVPLVLLAGNVRRSKVRILVTCLLALVLYLRLELLHDWILG
ncbi:EpsG family protein [Fluviibacter phosphoraccumulans]|uniref:EpsG family protein n=1 Tax=Fluviibacter phosphoraccumulans TaxID=1751046 RepID=A0A7R6R4V7_9RHOO|nr:EpsG family protein [Fluviibacter phosphoraccumulans]BBU67999.1 hypothetical protein ICHIAU1_02820 [Fluviibacter phosphoraccumulans]BBU70462.1 hypothetical protein ICHIJ1_03810 [Fluviibacter phosphoraccumulans]